MKKRFLTVLLGILCATGIMRSQSSTDVPSLPQLSTPSPKATMIDRFGYYPTNLYTGLVDITIPIHTIEVKGIKIPIEFKYHASGLKYDDLPMEVGYGWTLMAGGSVSYNARAASAYLTRGEKGDPYIKLVSDIVKNDKTASSTSDQLQLDYVMEGNKYDYTIRGKYRDSEYDVYNFSFPGHSGQYYVLDEDTHFTVPASTLSLYGSPYGASARDGLGNFYEFDVKDSDGDVGRNYTHYLTKIISADHGETVNFVYDEINLGATSKLVQRPIIDNTYIMKENQSTGNVETAHGGTPGISWKLYNTPILKEINWKGGKVEFLYSATEIRCLEQIRIYQNGSLAKTVRLDKTNNAYLDAVRFFGSDNKEVCSYNMQYNGTKPEGRVSVDYWGYYNSSSVSSSSLYVPNFQISTTRRIPGMNRTPDEFYMKKGILTKIVYPTKGYTTFDYEGHRGRNHELYGGLRIKELKSYDETGKLLEKKWYKYGSDESGNGREIRRVDATDYVQNTYLLEAYYPVGFEGAQINKGSQIRVSTYNAFPICSYLQQGSTVVYPSVTEYTGTSATPEGKTIYSFTDFTDEWYYGTMRGHRTEIPKWSYFWKCGKLLSKTVQDNTGKTVYSVSNTYEEINRKDYLNLRVLPYYYLFGGASGTVEAAFSSYPEFANAMSGSLYDYYNYYITSAEYAVKESRELLNGVYKTTRYKYNPLGQVSEETLVQSDSSERIVRNQYTVDLWEDAMTSSIYNAMYQANMLDPVLKKDVFIGNKLIDRYANEYKLWTDKLIALQHIERQAGGTYLQPRITYGSYDKYGNPASIFKDNNHQTYYLWGYQGQRLIAEIKGADLSTLGQALIDRVTSASYPSPADMAAIEALRSNRSLYGCRLTTYYYDTYMNLSKLVMPSGTATSYEYDSFGRLSCIKDHNGKIMETYQYDYKQ